MINALRPSLSNDHLGFPDQHAWHCPPSLGNRHLKDCRLSPSSHEAILLQSHSSSQAQSETIIGWSFVWRLFSWKFGIK